jgi:hypothetical protein
LTIEEVKKYIEDEEIPDVPKNPITAPTPEKVHAITHWFSKVEPQDVKYTSPLEMKLPPFKDFKYYDFSEEVIES